MIPYLKARIRNCIINWKHPELQSGKILNIDTVRHINEIYSRNGAIEDPISPLGYKEIGYTGVHSELADIFTGVELGTWAIDSRTMDWLWDFLNQNKPNTILEFGSGSSTCLFCAWMKKHNQNGIVISVDQSTQESKKTKSRLSTHNISDKGHVICMDVDATGKFIIDTGRISAILNGKKIDMLFVDGPAGSIGCRENTLKESMQLFASSGHWFLHDAYRVGELGILEQWSKIDGITAQGILACGHGLGIGHWNCK